jgi:Fe-S cluster assembly protein SufD
VIMASNKAKHVFTVHKDAVRVEVLPAGVSEREYRVVHGVRLSLVLTGTGSFDAHITVRLAGVGAAATITGILIGSGDVKQVLRTMQIHEAPSTTSDLLVKTVLSGHAACLYDGGIRVEKSAQKTTAYQRNENLLLSENAAVESKPSLEILANDVRCTHGAATGPVNEEQLWYLRSRGLTRHKAEALLVRGFVQSALTRVGDTDMKRIVERQLPDTV